MIDDDNLEDFRAKIIAELWREAEAAVRADGYYWIRHLASRLDPAPTVARCVDGHWYLPGQQFPVGSRHFEILSGPIAPPSEAKAKCPDVT